MKWSQKQKDLIRSPFNKTIDWLEGTPRSGKTTAGIARYATNLIKSKDTSHLVVAYSAEQAYRLIMEGDGLGLMHIFKGMCRPSHDDSGAHLKLFFPEGEKKVYWETGIDSPAVWRRSVNGGEAVELAAELGDSLELLVGDMDYLACYSVSEADFPAYGLDKDTTRMTLVYVKIVGGVEVETVFELTLGDIDKYGYYYANPEGTPLTMLLGGSVFHKVMTGADEEVSAAP